MTTVVIVEGVVLVVLAVLVTGLLRAYATVLQRLHELSGAVPSADVSTQTTLPPPSSVQAAPRDEWTEAYDISGFTTTGEAVAMRTVGVEHDTVLLFLSSGCSTCAGFWDELSQPGGVPLPAGVRLVVVTQGLEAESEASLRAFAPPDVDVVLSTQAWTDYGVPGSPYVVLVDGRTGRVRGEGTGQSWAQVAHLLAQGSGDAAYLTGGPSIRKPDADAEREAAADRELLAAGIVPGDPRLY